MEPYAPRSIHPDGLLETAGWRLKCYAISLPDAVVDASAFTDGVEMAIHALPQPARADGRPGIAIMIAHEGRGARYVVLAWWDRENELPVRVFVAPHDEGGAWRAARDGESFCVWDMQVLWFEREAYVETVMDPGIDEGEAEYLSEWLTVEPE
jgi:hypothetical protein